MPQGGAGPLHQLLFRGEPALQGGEVFQLERDELQVGTEPVPGVGMRSASLRSSGEPAFNRGLLDDGGVGFRVAVDPVQQRVELFHRTDLEAGDEAVVTGDLVALGELGDVLDLSLDLVQLAGQGRMRTIAWNW